MTKIFRERQNQSAYKPLFSVFIKYSSGRKVSHSDLSQKYRTIDTVQILKNYLVFQKTIEIEVC